MGAAHVSDQETAILEYDSDYAAKVTQRVFRARSNLSLVLRTRAAYDAVAARVIWRKVEAHTGSFLNERADQLAKCGARGIIRGAAEVLLCASDHPV